MSTPSNATSINGSYFLSPPPYLSTLLFPLQVLLLHLQSHLLGPNTIQQLPLCIQCPLHTDGLMKVVEPLNPIHVPPWWSHKSRSTIVSSISSSLWVVWKKRGGTRQSAGWCGSERRDGAVEMTCTRVGHIVSTAPSRLSLLVHHPADRRVSPRFHTTPTLLTALVIGLPFSSLLCLLLIPAKIYPRTGEWWSYWVAPTTRRAGSPSMTPKTIERTAELETEKTNIKETDLPWHAWMVCWAGNLCVRTIS